MVSINLSNYQKILTKTRDFTQKTELLVVSKNRTLVDIMPSIVEKKHRLFGENRVMEAQKKFTHEFLKEFDINLHLIGPLQTNKVDIALSIFHTIQTIDRAKLVDEIHKSIQKEKFPILTRNFFLQINIGSETQKSGIEIDQLFELYDKCLKSNLNIVGLMCIPPLNNSPSFYFENMLKLRDQLNPGLLLSMGMSNDYLEALKYKSNIIRIGSFLFS